MRVAPQCRIGLRLIALCATVTPAFAQTVDPPETEVITPTECIELFDGATLGDCYVWMSDSGRSDPRQVFRVDDGMLHVTGDGFGGILTNKSYRDYHLVLEFKWGGKTWGEREQAARDSGLLLHSTGADGGRGGMWMPALEVNIIEGGVGDFILVDGHDESGAPVPLSLSAHVVRDRDGEVVWNPAGKQETFNNDNLERINWSRRDPDWDDRIGFRGAEDVDSPHDEWTRLDVITDSDRIVTYVNGVKVNEGFRPTPSAGRIQLQTELAEIFFRRWEIYPLDGAPEPAPAEQ